mmetsp:Transcript_87106/g.243068  ORF Transcript_87106/g.243068 Transcript_87106/m.243068 type:complete len:247 (+) Transcript_87106:1213-1953(+)
MIVTSFLSTCKRVARGLSSTILCTTDSGTKRAKSSMALKEVQNVSSKRLMSLIRERLPERSGLKASVSLMHLRLPSSCIRAVRFRRGSEMEQPSPRPTTMLTAATPANAKTMATLASFTATFDSSFSIVISLSCSSLRATTAALNSEAGSATTASQQVAPSIAIDWVPIWKQCSDCSKASHSMNRPSAAAVRFTLKIGCSVCNVEAFQDPYLSNIACDTVDMIPWSEFSAMIPSSVCLEELRSKPS